MTGKPVKASAVEVTQIIQPNDANALGTVFGGKVMAMMDEVAALAAMRHARKVVVTAGVDALDFRAPARIGHFLTLKAQVNYVGSTSMEVGVKAEAEDPLTGETRHTASAYLTFVALDGFGRPTSVAPVIPETEEEHRRYRDARTRRDVRLRRRPSGPAA
jgi:acyl-CoA hydrolase